MLTAALLGQLTGLARTARPVVCPRKGAKNRKGPYTSPRLANVLRMCGDCLERDSRYRTKPLSRDRRWVPVDSRELPPQNALRYVAAVDP